VAELLPDSARTGMRFAIEVPNGKLPPYRHDFVHFTGVRVGDHRQEPFRSACVAADHRHGDHFARSGSGVGAFDGISFRCPAVVCFNREDMARESAELDDLLRQVSRSFYLTLKVLPSSVKPPLGLAYLLARAADTVADTRIVPVEARLETLREVRQSILSACAEGLVQIPGGLARTGDPASPEHRLLERFGALLTRLKGFPPEDRRLLSEVLGRITHGQELDLTRFEAARPGAVSALRTDEELDEYAYLVAGCVGEFWTKICRRHAFPAARLEDRRLLDRSVRFGKGLQLVNILRDLPGDLRQGRCYIPQERLSRIGLRPEDLLDPMVMDRFAPLYREYLELAESHLSEGWNYTTSLPFRHARIRMSCAWPVLIGIRTLALLQRGNVLDERRRIRIGRREIRHILFRSAVLYPLRSSWNGQFGAVRSQCAQTTMKA